jgi:hypothetical protein
MSGDAKELLFAVTAMLVIVGIVFLTLPTHPRRHR